MSNITENVSKYVKERGINISKMALTECGFKASQKTVYSWENGNSRPDIEILMYSVRWPVPKWDGSSMMVAGAACSSAIMKLCDTYGIKDILKTFGYDGYKEDGSIFPMQTILSDS